MESVIKRKIKNVVQNKGEERPEVLLGAVQESQGPRAGRSAGEQGKETALRRQRSQIEGRENFCCFPTAGLAYISPQGHYRTGLYMRMNRISS